MPNTELVRSVVLPLLNKSGGSVAYGDVVVIDTANAAAFTTTTTVGYFATSCGVVLEPNGIASNATGMIAMSGYVPQINLSASASLGDFFKTHSVAKQAVRHIAPINQGDFGIVLNTGTTPPAILFGLPNATPTGGGADLWTEVIKTADQDVTNSNTLTNDNDLLFSFTADSYHIIMFILYSGSSAAGDYKFDLVPSAGTYSGWVRSTGDNTTADAVNVSTGARLAAVSSMAGTAGTDASDTVRHMMLEMMIRFSTTGTCNFKFAQNTATISTHARTKKGSIIRYRKLPVT